MIEQELLDEALRFLALSPRQQQTRQASRRLPAPVGRELPTGEPRPGEIRPAAWTGVTLPQVVERLRAAREEQGLSLGDLHEQTGISRGRLCRLENRVETNPTIGTLDRIAAALDLRLLVTLAEANEPDAPTDQNLADSDKVTPIRGEHS